MEVVYLICFFLGLGFAVLTTILSGVLGGFDAGLDIGGADVGGLDVDAGSADAGAHFSPWNPMVISIFLASFGGVGIICKNYIGMPLLPQLGFASLAAFAVGGVTFWLLAKFFSVVEVSSDVKVADIIDKEAEVTIAIPGDGVGQIAYISGGRYTSPAASIDKTNISQGSNVKIRKIVGSTFYVERIP